MPVLLPGGRRVTDMAARAEVARAWNVASLPDQPGRDTGQMLAAAADGELDALVVAGVDPYDLPDPRAALAALERAEFVISLELRVSAVTDRADVVFPVAAVAEKAGTFLNWEGRPGMFSASLDVPGVRTDLDVLAGIADAMDVHLGLPDLAAARREMTALGSRPSGGDELAGTGTDGAGQGSGQDAEPSSGDAGLLARGAQAARGLLERGGKLATGLLPGRDRDGGQGQGEVLLATWHNLLDAGRMQDGEPYLAATARPAVAMMSGATAGQAGVADGALVTVATGRGRIAVPVQVTAMPDGVVWLPANSGGCAVRRELGAGHGSLVMLSAGGPSPQASTAAPEETLTPGVRSAE